MTQPPEPKERLCVAKGCENPAEDHNFHCKEHNQIDTPKQPTDPIYTIGQVVMYKSGESTYIDVVTLIYKNSIRKGWQYNFRKEHSHCLEGDIIKVIGEEKKEWKEEHTICGAQCVVTKCELLQGNQSNT